MKDTITIEFTPEQVVGLLSLIAWIQEGYAPDRLESIADAALLSCGDLSVRDRREITKDPSTYGGLYDTFRRAVREIRPATRYTFR